MLSWFFGSSEVSSSGVEYNSAEEASVDDAVAAAMAAQMADLMASGSVSDQIASDMSSLQDYNESRGDEGGGFFGWLTGR